MTNPWVPLYVPLAKGLDQGKSQVAGSDNLTEAVNVDWPLETEVRGRPSRGTPVNFSVKDPTASILAPTYLTPVALPSTGFEPQALMRLRDVAGERPMLGTIGRLFSLETDGAQWEDRGPFTAMRHDRVATTFVHGPGGDPERIPVGPDFFKANGNFIGLLDPHFSFQRFDPITTNIASSSGTMARCGNITATVVRSSSGNELWLLTRVNGASTITESLIASDAALWTNEGDAACICCDHDQTHFFVMYKTTTGTQFKVLRVSTAGSVTHTYTDTGLITGDPFWIANGTVAGNRLVLCVGTPTGFNFRTLEADDLTYTTTDSGVTTEPAKAVVIGFEGATKYWFATLSENVNDPSGTDLTIGVGDADTDNSLVNGLLYYGGAGGILWRLVHQPILVDGRMYITVGAGLNAGFANAGTWFTYDLSNLKVSTLTTNGPFQKPTIVARGESYALSITTNQPESAIILADGTGWTFPTHDWTAFSTDFASVTVGNSPVSRINKLSFMAPRSVLAGSSTLISGSVPRIIAGDESHEAGFPLTAPYCIADKSAGGTVVNGTYGVVAVWRYTDASGQVHRSAPSPVSTIEITTGNNVLTAEITNPYITDRPTNSPETIYLEVYVTDTNPTADDPHYLQIAFTSAANLANVDGTTVVEIDEPIDTTGEVLYTDGGAFSNFVPPCDGGIATVGSRVWMASGSTVYASKTIEPEVGTAWSDEGSLQVDLPAGAGRVVSLENLDDKLVIFCERGVFALQDGGPNNIGQGPDFPPPFRMSDLGVAGPRSTALTDRGIVFCSPLDSVDASRGGPWLLDRSLTITDRTFLGLPATNFFLGTVGWVPEVTYSPERQQVYITTAQSTTDADCGGVVVIDFRSGKFCTWEVDLQSATPIASIECVKGLLWTLYDEPAAFDGEPGTDADSVGAYEMRIKTSHIYSNGSVGLGWARTRSVRPLPSVGGGAHTMTMRAVLDQTRTVSSGAVTVPAAAAGSTWPTSKQDPEWRLPTQKCSSLQVELSATPAVARWSAIRIDVLPLPPAGPAGSRT